MRNCSVPLFQIMLGNQHHYNPSFLYGRAAKGIVCLPVNCSSICQLVPGVIMLYLHFSFHNGHIEHGLYGFPIASWIVHGSGAQSSNKEHCSKRHEFTHVKFNAFSHLATHSHFSSSVNSVPKISSPFLSTSEFYQVAKKIPYIGHSKHLYNMECPDLFSGNHRSCFESRLSKYNSSVQHPYPSLPDRPCAYVPRRIHGRSRIVRSDSPTRSYVFPAGLYNVCSSHRTIRTPLPNLSIAGRNALTRSICAYQSRTDSSSISQVVSSYSCNLLLSLR